MSRLLALCCVCMLMLVGAANSSQDLIVRVEDGNGNLITDAQVVFITSGGDHLKADQLPEGTYVYYDVGVKVTLEIEHEAYGSARFEVVPSREEIPKNPLFAGQIHKTVVLGPRGLNPELEPPSNDLCEDAIPVAVPSATAGTTTDAGIDWPDMPDCGVVITSPGVWYSVIGTGTTIFVETCGATWDTKISVYCRGCDLPICIGGNDDACGLQSRFSWCSEYGVEYMVLVHGYGGQSGPFDLTVYEDGEGCTPDITCPAPPENDLCDGAIPVTIPSVTLGSTAGASPDYDVEDCGYASITSPGVWYSLIGDGTTLTATTCADLYDFDTKLSVYCGDCGDLICVDGNDDECYDGASFLLSTVTWCSQAMAEYKILVHGYGGAFGDFELDVSSDGVACVAEVACIPTGACCFPDASCADGLTQYECEDQGGTYQGDDSVCGGGFVGWSAVEDCANAFEDISGTGTELYLGDDDGEVVPLGFTFNFWGDIHADIGVCSNGYLTFGEDLTDFSNDYIPDDYDPNDYIAPLWDDLAPNDGGTVHYQTLGMEPNRRFIAQWTNVPQFYTGDSNTFQAILFEGTNCIELRYGVITPESYEGDYTVGVENQDGTDGLSIPGADVGDGVCKSICPVFTEPIVCPLEVPFDIKPGSCVNPYNTNSNGKLPVAILGTADFDVYDVDPATITLEGVSALRWSYEDVGTPYIGTDVCGCSEEGPDGYMDLTLKFDRPDLTEAMGDVTDGEIRPLSLLGALYDGYPIYGWDCVLIKDKGPDPDPPPVISIETFTGVSSTIGFSLSEPTHVTMVIYDVQGKRVQTVVNEMLPSGDHRITWNGRDQRNKSVVNGMYFCRVEAGGIEKTVKMLLTQ
ncbi:MAG: FlgD immunoglobulin-like domain containing protein [Candidatus Eisenbacteria bacterium]